MGKKKYSRWTPEEHQALMDLIKEHPDNMREAYKIHSANTGRSECTIRDYFQRYRMNNDLPVGSRARWSERELKDLLKLIEQHPENLEAAFREHAKNTGRPLNSVRKKFFSYRKQEDAKICMMVVGRNRKVSPNRKNIHAKTGGETSTLKVSKWRRILDIIFE